MDKYRILVKGILKNEDKYLIVRKWYDDRIADPYQWEFITEEVDFKEAPDKAVIRHIYEQVGISAMIDRIAYTWSFMTGDVFNIGISYLCIASQDEVLLSDQLDNYTWINRDQFDEYIDKKVIEDIDRAEL